MVSRAMRNARFLLALLLLAAPARAASPPPAPVPDELQNPWPADLERDFRARADLILRAQTAAKPPGGNTYFENEKRAYGLLMAHALAGRSAEAFKLLQGE